MSQRLSRTNHALCRYCWRKKNPQGEAQKEKWVDRHYCCDCGFPTLSGLYMAGKAEDFKCKGNHE